MVLKGDADKTHLLGGRVRALPQPKNPKFGKYVKSPLEVRALLRQKGWNRVVAFQTRNPLHRAHEYALVYGLEQLSRQGHNAGAVPQCRWSARPRGTTSMPRFACGLTRP